MCGDKHIWQFVKEAGDVACFICDCGAWKSVRMYAHKEDE